MSLQKNHANEESSSAGSKRRKTYSNNCHQCHRKDRERVVQCTKCQKNYCFACITKWYPRMAEVSIAESCPECRNICNCLACLQSTGKKDALIQDLNLSTEDKVQFSKYIVRTLVPSLKNFVLEQNMETAEEANIQGLAELLRKAESVAEGEEHADCLLLSKETCSCYRSDQESSDNYLHCPTITDAGKHGLKHFQWHLKEGEPVIVPDVLKRTCGLSWEPFVLWCICRKSLTNKRDVHITVQNCSNSREEKVEMLDFFKGYSEGFFDSERRPKILRLDDWPPSESFEERLPRHSAEFFNCLPFKQCTHPRAEMSLKIPLRRDLGLKMHVGYGVPQELGCHSVTKLQYALSDRVNVLMHTAAIYFDPAKLSKREKKRTHVSQDQGPSITNEEATRNGQRLEDLEGGAVWDVFRREDVPKLEEYLETHSRELRDISSQQVVMINERTLYLTEEHKRKLKEEYGIVPWTFVQRLGDAVFIPAGCIHQIKNLKSCTSISANFVSPESVAECIRLSAKDDRFEVKKMTIRALNQAVEYLGSIAPATSTSTNTNTSAPLPVAPTTIGSGEQNGANPPSHQQMRQNCEHMLLMLEQQGHRFAPEMRNYLKHEIRLFLNNLIRIIQGSSSSSY